LDTAVSKKGSIRHKDCVGSLANEACEGRIDIAAATGIESLDS
jgi:hypothetical protein